jgi:hypothetical protein
METTANSRAATRLKADPREFRRLMAGDAEATALFENLKKNGLDISPGFNPDAIRVKNET